jgi:thiosulfate/3-mercaptopyruvate sulfurtransferase
MATTTLRSFSSLVSTQELASSLDNKKTKVLDASWHMPNTNRDPYQEFLANHIPGARFFGIDTIKDTSVDLPHMLPSAAAFAESVGKKKKNLLLIQSKTILLISLSPSLFFSVIGTGDLGISNDDHVVVYDSVGAFSAARVYWTFKAFGHDQVSILNGGLPAWIQQGLPLSHDNDNGDNTKATYQAKLNPRLVRDYPTVLQNCQRYQQGDNDVAQILDARALVRFTGEAPEPRAGLSSGHMPGSICVPFQEVATQDGHYKDEKALHALFESKGVDLDRPIIASCGK